MMDRRDYWIECVSIAAEECGAVLTAEQIANIAGAVEGAHENVHMAFGRVESPYPSEIKRLERELSIERNKTGCLECGGRGRVNYMAGPWHCNSPCDVCHGEGKVAA